MLGKIARVFGFAGMMLLIIAPIIAQEARAVTGGLSSPRHIMFGPDGSLYVAYAGNGGDIETRGPFGPAAVGSSSGVTVVRPDGSQELLIHSQSSMDWGWGQPVGLHTAYATDNGLWLLIGQGDRRNPFNYGLVELGENMRVRRFVDLYSFEEQNNPDGEIIDSNPVDIAVGTDGTIYIADAGANSVLKWTESGGLELFNTWTQDNPVPTSVEVDGEGNVYVGFLSGFPFTSQGSRVEKYSADGALIETFTGLNPIIDLELHGDTLYVVEFGEYGDEGWLQNTGRIVTVSSEGITPVSEILNLPYGMAVNSNGEIFVAINSIYGNIPGVVIQLGADGSGDIDAPLAPVATEDAG